MPYTFISSLVSFSTWGIKKSGKAEAEGEARPPCALLNHCAKGHKNSWGISSITSTSAMCGWVGGSQKPEYPLFLHHTNGKGITNTKNLQMSYLEAPSEARDNPSCKKMDMWAPSMPILSDNAFLEKRIILFGRYLSILGTQFKKRGSSFPLTKMVSLDGE